MKVTKSRVMGMAFRACYGVNVHDCVVQYCARDGINTADCTSVSICYNRVEWTDDDAIAGHTSYFGVTDRGYVVTGNTIRFAQGIRLMGAISATVTSNTIEFVMSQGIDVQTAAPATGREEGVNAGSGILIANNTIKNCIDRGIVDGLNHTCPYIRISGNSAQAGSLAAIPGQNDPATGTIVALYSYFKNSTGSSTTVPIPGTYNLTIGDNIMIRDIEPSGLLSALGLGTFYTRSGPIDPELTPEAMKLSGIHAVGGLLANVNMHDNLSMGVNSGLEISLTTRFINSRYHHNMVVDCKDGVSIDQSNAQNQELYITDNVFDIDPLFVHPNRGANGTWLAEGTPQVFLIQAGKGLVIARNVIKNVCRISDGSVNSASVLQGNTVLYLENILECDPINAGAFDVNNKGIGNCPRAGGGFIHRIVDCDPASTTYRQTLNNCPLALPSIPTTGKYVRGHTVRTLSPSVQGTAGSRYTVTGWLRVTTGSAHVPGTDWVEMRSLTGT